MGETFVLALTTVCITLLYAVPGFVLAKIKRIGSEQIPAMANVLVCLCAPCIFIHALQEVPCTKELLLKIGIFASLAVFLQGLVLFLSWLLLHKKFEDNAFRIFSIAPGLANVAFFGLPLLKAVLPDYPEAITFCGVFAVTMNLFCWTVASFFISGDKKYISPKKALLNPAVIGFLIGFVLFLLKIRIPASLDSAIDLCGKMSTPLCMIVLGARLATVRPRDLFLSFKSYLAVFARLVGVPLLALALLSFIPVESGMKAAFFIMCCCPAASNVLSFAELFRRGQAEAARQVLLTTLFSAVTVPMMALLMPR